jgi:hypothetical protein
MALRDDYSNMRPPSPTRENIANYSAWCSMLIRVRLVVVEFPDIDTRLL